MKKETEIKPIISQIPFAIKVLEEKVSREYGLSNDELKEKVITIINGELKITDIKK